MSFYEHFKKNMEELGLPAPVSLYDTSARAIVTTTTILNALKVVGGAASTVTLSEIAGATVGLEALAVGGGILASFYVGAVIGALASASFQSLSDIMSANNTSSTSINYVVAFAGRNNLNYPELGKFLSRHPEILNHNITDRKKASARLA